MNEILRIFVICRESSTKKPLKMLKQQNKIASTSYADGLRDFFLKTISYLLIKSIKNTIRIPKKKSI